MKKPNEIAAAYSDAGQAKINNTPTKTFLLSVLAGAYIALGALGSQIANASVADTGMVRFIGALVFPVGLVMVIIAGAELFTGNSLLVIPVLDKKADVTGMLKNWLIVYAGNFIGSLLVAAAAVYGHLPGFFDGKLAALMVSTAATKTSLTFSEGLIRGILCTLHAA